MKKILVNAYVNLNFGDDLFLKILFDRYPNVKWILPKGGDIYINIFKNYKNVEIKDSIIFKVKNKLRILEKNSILNKYDAGVYIGGSIFMQIPEWKRQLQDRKEVISSFAKENKPYFILGSNFGPFKNNEFYEEYNQLFNDCEDICFRDTYSKELFESHSNVRLAPDIVFQLAPKGLDKEKKSLGISLIEIKNRADLVKYRTNYINKFKDITERAIENGEKVTFFSFCEAQGDLEIIEEIVNCINPKYKKSIEVVNYRGNIDEFLEKFEKMEKIIGTRFHACILSQVFNQGLYPIIYSEKTYNVLKDIGLDKNYSWIKDIDNLNIDTLFGNISNNKISEKSIFKKSEKQFEELDKYVATN